MSLQDHQRVEINDKKGRTKVELEMMWSSKVSETDVKIKMGDQEAVIDMKDLFYFVFTAGTEDMKADLMPVRQTKVYHQVKMHRVVAKELIKPGQTLNVKCEIDIPVEVVDTLRGSLYKKGRDMITGPRGVPVLGK